MHHLPNIRSLVNPTQHFFERMSTQGDRNSFFVTLVCDIIQKQSSHFSEVLTGGFLMSFPPDLLIIRAECCVKMFNAISCSLSVSPVGTSLTPRALKPTLLPVGLCRT